MTDEKNNDEKLVKGTGLLIVEVRDSNPNGDPDRESDPRQRNDERGEISPVSFKRKIRDLVENKEGPVWQEIEKKLSLQDKVSNFDILESRNRGFKDVKDAAEAWRKVIDLIENDAMKNRYWDARVFGSTFLEKGEDAPESVKGKKDRKYIKTGVAQFGLGVSIAPVDIRRLTNTKKASAQETKDRGMAPLGYRIVQHGVYCMPFFINPTAATKSGCTKDDIDILLKIIPYAYPHTASYIRSFVDIRHAWYMEHKSAIGSCSDFMLIDALTPKKKDEPEKPSISWENYEAPTSLPDKLNNKIKSFCDLMEKI